MACNREGCKACLIQRSESELRGTHIGLGPSGKLEAGNCVGPTPGGRGCRSRNGGEEVGDVVCGFRGGTEQSFAGESGVDLEAGSEGIVEGKKSAGVQGILATPACRDGSRPARDLLPGERISIRTIENHRSGEGAGISQADRAAAGRPDREISKVIFAVE